MAVTYALVNAAGTLAQRSSDMAFVPWDPQLNAPADQGYAYRIWLADGSPPPTPYATRKDAP